MLTGLQHIGIYVEDMEEATNFYKSVFDFKEVSRSNAMEGDLPLLIVFMKHSSGIKLELLHTEGKNPKQSASATPNHLTFRVDDAEAAYNKLKEHGVNLETPVLSAPLGFDTPLKSEDMDVFRSGSNKGAKVQIFFLRGPSGERIEIMADNIGWED